MITLTTQPTGEVEQVELFSLDGTVYTVPAKPRASIGLRYLRTLRKGNAQTAEAELLTSLLGANGYDALCEFDSLTAEQLNEITEMAMKIALGDVEAGELPTGN